MKPILLIILPVLLFNEIAIAQTGSDTRVLITDLINNYGHSSYKIYSTYADEMAPGDLKRYFDINGQDLNRILVVERCSNTAALCITNFFDLKGIETVAVVKEGNYLTIKLKILSHYLSVEEERIFEDKTKQTDTVLIFFGVDSRDQAERLKKTLIQVSKSYGGQPRDI